MARYLSSVSERNIAPIFIARERGSRPGSPHRLVAPLGGGDAGGWRDNATEY